MENVKIYSIDTVLLRNFKNKKVVNRIYEMKEEHDDIDSELTVSLKRSPTEGKRFRSAETLTAFLEASVFRHFTTLRKYKF